MAIKTEEYTTKKGKVSKRYVLAELSDEVVQFLNSGRYLSYVDRKNGKVYAVNMNVREPLSPEERARREKEKAERRKKWLAKRKASIEKKLKELEEKRKKLEREMPA